MDEANRSREMNDSVDGESAAVPSGGSDERELDALPDGGDETAGIGKGLDSDQDLESSVAELPQSAAKSDAETESEDLDAAGRDRAADRNLEELSVAEFIGMIRKSPLKNLRRFRASANESSRNVPGRFVPALAPAISSSETAQVEVTRQPVRIRVRWLFQRTYVQLALYTLAIASALVGSAAARGCNRRVERWSGST